MPLCRQHRVGVDNSGNNTGKSAALVLWRVTSSTSHPFLIRRPDGSSYTYHRMMPAEIVPWLDGEIRLGSANEPLSLTRRKVVKVSLGTGDLRLAKDRWRKLHNDLEEAIGAAKVRSWRTSSAASDTTSRGGLTGTGRLEPSA